MVANLAYFAFIVAALHSIFALSLTFLVIINRFSAYSWVLSIFCGWFVVGLVGLWVASLICGWFGWFVGGFEFYS